MVNFRSLYTRLLAMVVSLAMLSSCQLIKEEDRLIPIQAQEPQSMGLITEFTGFRCVNCPNAAEQAHTLLDKYPDNLVVVEMHPKTNTFCQTAKPEYDFTCPEADIYYAALGGTSTTAFPTGVVDFSSGLQDYSAWPSLVMASVVREKIGSLSLSVDPSQNSRDLKLTYQVTASAKDEALTGKKVSLQLLLWLVEDSIVGPQMMPDGSTNMEYVHNHVLRGSLMEDPWGTTCECAINEMYLGMQSLTFTVPDSINGQAIRLEHCSVVGVLLDPDSRALRDVRQLRL